MTRGFKVGGLARCPADRGDPAYTGRVTHVSKEQRVNMHGTPYHWVTVEMPGGKRRHVWPSHRISAVARAGAQ